MADEYSDTTPAWIETSALTAPALLGAAAGLLLGDLMHRGARRGVGIGLGALGIAALLPFVVGGVFASSGNTAGSSHSPSIVCMILC